MRPARAAAMLIRPRRAPRDRQRACMVALAAAMAGLGPAAAAPEDGAPLSPLAVLADSAGTHLYVAEVGARRVAVFDITAQAAVRHLATSGPPGGLALSPDGRELYVTCAGPEGAVDVFTLATGERTRTLHAGHTPTAPVLSSDGRELYVCNRFAGSVSVLDTGPGSGTGRLAEIPVPREPVAAARTPDGHRLLVAHHVPDGPANRAPQAARVSVLATAERRLVATIELPGGSTGVRGLCVAADGRHGYVTHVLARHALPTTQLERGWMNTNALSVIDVPAARLLNTVLLDEPERGAANPWGVAGTADGRWLCVAHAGTHELSIIDQAALLRKLARVAAGERVSEVSAAPGDVPNDLAFLHGIRRRVPLGGHGPRGVAVIGERAYVAEYFTDSLGVVALGPNGPGGAPAVSLPLGRGTPAPSPAAGAVRWGERLFNDATLCFQQWQSCASCHPDGRADGLNWDLLNDGIGNAKNTKSLLKAHATPPAMSLGVRGDAEAAVRAGLRHILFASRPEAEAQALDAYLRSLEPETSPALHDGRPSAAAQRGREVFERAGCARCHSGALYTDGKPYDVGTAVADGPAGGEALVLDTPALIELWRTAPYLHDGRAATLDEVLQEHNAGDRHGATAGLSAEERAALVAFLLAL